MRFTIMQGTPGYLPGEGAAEEAITGQEGIVLRVLILHHRRSLAKDEIAHHLRRSGRSPYHRPGVPGYIARLRNRIGQEYVRSTASYTSAMDPADVDAFAFERLITRYGICDIADIDTITAEQVDRYEQMLELYAMWKANPALPFADYQDDEFLTSRYQDFERYWDYLRRCIIYAELRSHRKPRIKEAISRLEQLLRQDPHDDSSWALLFRARASLPTRETTTSVMLARIQAEYPDGIPAELRYTVNRIISGHDDALFEIDRGQRSDKDQQQVDRLVQAIGISPASELGLRRSKLEPLECIGRETVSQLRFAGILRAKWVADSYVRAQFTRLLERLDNNGGSVQFLLLNPESESYQKFSELRWSSGGVQPIDMLHRLSAAHPSFAVRLYDTPPPSGASSSTRAS